MIRVIAGSRRSIPLKTLDGMATRPTQDRIKETLFNVIQMEVPGSNFLDLYAGSGQIGIEALSRGALSATLVDSKKQAIAIINENLEKTRFIDDAKVYCREAIDFVRSYSGKIFDIIHMDPPYALGEERTCLSAIKEADILNDNGLVIIEAVRENDIENHIPDGYDIEKVKIYKTNKHIFLRKA